MSWVDQLATAKHKAVFDAPLITSGLAPGHVDLYLKNYKEIYNVDERDMRAVLVIRHEAVPMFLSDAFWAKYQMGQKLRLNDPATGTATVRNYFALGGARPIPDLTTLESLKSRGVIILGCHKALMSVASIMAQAAGVASETVQAEARAAVLPFVTLMPSGIFAVMRAQEAGCQYIRST
jgi:intracellular sulfur oxidation DsrE/DsrF family protein